MKINADLRITPEEVIRLVEEVEPRIPAFDPTLGIPRNKDTPVPAGTAKNRLVVLGDSLSHGFQSGSIFNTDLSWPAIVAWEMGIYDTFRRPHYQGFGGLPLNIEFVIRDLEKNYGNKTDIWDIPHAAFHVPHLLDQIEDYWERGAGAKLPGAGSAIPHNLAVFGFDVREVLSFTDNTAANRIKGDRDQWWFQNQIVEHSMEIASRRVLHSARNSAGQALSPVQAAKELGQDGGIETLVVAIGANNALGSILGLCPQWTADNEDYADLDKKGSFNVWRPSHFEKEYDQLIAEVEKIDAENVILATVPHVTIAPIAKGIGGKVSKGSAFFTYYTRPWVEESKFDPKDDAHLTAAEARALDTAIDAYNRHIESKVAAARKAGKNWYLFEFSGLLERLAFRRYQEDIDARPAWWTAYELPPVLAALDPLPDTRFFRSGPEGRREGGIFSLDGVHGTTVAYGIIAQEVINILQIAGVKLRLDGGAERIGRVNVDFDRLLKNDTLMKNPPASLDNDLGLIGWLDEKADCFRRLFGKPSLNA